MVDVGVVPWPFGKDQSVVSVPVVSDIKLRKMDNILFSKCLRIIQTGYQRWTPLISVFGFDDHSHKMSVIFVNFKILLCK